MDIVIDQSVLMDGRSHEVADGTSVLVPSAVVTFLEAKAREGMETARTALAELADLQHRVDLQFPVVEGEPSAAARALADRGQLWTSDHVQAMTCAGMGIQHKFLRREETEPEILAFFEDDVMSVHLKEGVHSMVKRGTPGKLSYERFGRELGHKQMRALMRDCIECTNRSHEGFVELERHGCTVLQLGNMRITLAEPPFSDGLEITAVRPVTRLELSDYSLDDVVMERIEGHARGIFIAGPPGSGKSTFAAALATYLHEDNRVVKTMEQPRDLQVPEGVTQYGALDRDMQWTGEVLLLVRPDHVVFDEVRTTNDFTTFADMRLAGIGLFGVTHANRPIDAVQRMIGRIDLGLIPQIVDTIVFIAKGEISHVMELEFSVRVPSGMKSDDLARPVVVVKNLATGEEEYELYSFGEQVVVMPMQGVQEAPAGLENQLRRFVRGPMELQMRGGTAVIRVQSGEIPTLIGKGGRTVQALERRLGVHLDIQALPDAPRGHAKVQVRKTGSNVFLILAEHMGGRLYEISVEGAVIGECLASQQGRLRFKATSPEGMAIMEAHKRGFEIDLRPV